MDSTQFDALARAWAGRSRRGLVHGLGGVGLAALLGWDQVDEAGAKKKRNRRKGSSNRSRLAGEGKKKKKKGKKKGGGSVPPPPPTGAGNSGGTPPPPPPTQCVPTLTCAGIECGAFPDNGCGQVLNCGGCPQNKMCDGSNTCVCATECCSNAECVSGRCSAGGACCAAAGEVCPNAGAQCGTVSDACGAVDCGGCAEGDICDQQNQCFTPCPQGEVPCGGACVRGVCCWWDGTGCPGGEVCTVASGGESECCRPEGKAVTCFPTQGAPFCGTVEDNCRQPVECGGCPASGEICAADNRCGSCPDGTRAVKGATPDEDVCCPDSGVCNGQSVCCNQTVDICGNGPSICCDDGVRCGTPSGGICRQPGTASSCCQGSCQFQGIDFCGQFGRCS